ncbi:MAG: cytochrome P450 [Bacteroidota bacterium]
MSAFKRKLTRKAFGIMRTIAPKITFGKNIYLFRDADVREILRRDKDFTLRQINEKKIVRRIGEFLLNMDDSPQYRLEVGVLRSIILPEDPERIRNFVRTHSRELAQKLAGKIRFDMVQDFARIIPLRLTGDYMGFPGPDDATMLKWNRDLFADIFLNLSDKPDIAAAGEESAAGLNAYMSDLIAKRKQALEHGARLPNDLLSRLLTKQQGQGPSLDDDGIRRNMAGVLMGGIEPTAKAVTNILDELFHRPDLLAEAREAAENDAIDIVSKIAFEAFRFRPNLPVILRWNESPQTIGGDGRKRRRLKGQKRIFAFINSAMFDGRAFPEPEAFSLDRPKADYLYFGAGLHKCYGNYINYIQIPEMLAALLRIPNLRPVPGRDGKIVKDGTFPDRWLLEVEDPNF